MIKWLKRLFHLHDWETQGIWQLKMSFPWSEKTHREGRRYYLRCKECGVVKMVDLI